MAVGVGCDFDESAQLDAKLADCETHVLVRNRIELGRCFLVQRARALKVPSLRVQDGNRGLNQSLVKELHFAVRALPDFLPCFMTLEEASLIEEVDSLFVKIWVCPRHTIRCSDANMTGNGTVRNFNSSARMSRYTSALPDARTASKSSNHTSATPS